MRSSSFGGRRRNPSRSWSSRGPRSIPLGKSIAISRKNAMGSRRDLDGGARGGMCSPIPEPWMETRGDPRGTTKRWRGGEGDSSCPRLDGSRGAWKVAREGRAHGTDETPRAPVCERVVPTTSHEGSWGSTSTPISLSRTFLLGWSSYGPRLRSRVRLSSKVGLGGFPGFLESEDYPGTNPIGPTGRGHTWRRTRRTKESARVTCVAKDPPTPHPHACDEERWMERVGGRPREGG